MKKSHAIRDLDEKTSLNQEFKDILLTEDKKMNKILSENKVEYNGTELLQDA